MDLVAESAREAISVLRKHAVDLIITDQRMPQMTGVQLLEAIQPEYPDTVRMILTGFTDIDAIVQAINTGRVHQYMTKPYDVEALKVALGRAIELQLARRRNRELVRALELAATRAKTIRLAFQKYVPEAVVEAVVDGRGKDSVMRGESRMVTVMFCRIHGFMGLASKLSADALFSLLDAYYDRMSRVIQRHKGLLAELVSDEILAVFGAPVSSLSNEQNAAEAALAMLDAIAVFNRDRAVPVLGEPLRIGIGINRGEVIAGNIGSQQRMKYGVIGDAVNVASRIQNQTRAEANEILVSAEVREWLDADLRTTPRGRMALRGRTAETELFEVPLRAPRP